MVNGEWSMVNGQWVTLRKKEHRFTQRRIRSRDAVAKTISHFHIFTFSHCTKGALFHHILHMRQSSIARHTFYYYTECFGNIIVVKGDGHFAVFASAAQLRIPI